MSMEASLERFLARHAELETMMSAGAAEDPQEFARLSKEYSDLEPVVAGIRELHDAQSEMADLGELIADPETDAEMKERPRRGFWI